MQESRQDLPVCVSSWLAQPGLTNVLSWLGCPWSILYIHKYIVVLFPTWALAIAREKGSFIHLPDAQITASPDPSARSRQGWSG